MLLIFYFSLRPKLQKFSLRIIQQIKKSPISKYFFVLLHHMTDKEKHKSLRQRTARGFLWGVVNNGSMQLLGAFFGVILMNLLQPQDYGKIAMLLIFSQIAATIQESGFTHALCNLNQPRHEDYNAIFWCNIGVSASLYTILFFSAPLIADFYDDPSLLWLSRFLFLGFFISALGCVQRAYLFIHMMNRESAITAIVAMLISGSVGVAMAYGGWTFWGLAAQNVLFVLTSQIMNWYFSPWRPRLVFDLRPARHMFGFGSKLLLTNLFNNLSAHAFGVLLGKFYGSYSAGIYSNARRWSDMGSNTINGMVNGVALPVLTKVRQDQGRYVMVFRKMLRFVSFISFPAMLGLSLVARDFLFIISGEKWLNSASLLSMLCIYGAFVPLQTLYSQISISKGLSNINLYFTIGQCLITWSGLIALRTQCIELMVLFFILINLIYMGLWQWWAKRLIGLSLKDALRDISPFFLLSLSVMVLCHLLTRNLENTLFRLISKIILSAIMYIGMLWILRAKILRESLDYLLKRDRE